MKKRSQTLLNEFNKIIYGDAFQNVFVPHSIVEICNHCGHSVAFGSGRFVNRIPDLNDIFIRLDNGLLFPHGDYVCEECDNNPKT
jgi:hypothetical protein